MKCFGFSVFIQLVHWKLSSVLGVDERGLKQSAEEESEVVSVISPQLGRHVEGTVYISDFEDFGLHHLWKPGVDVFNRVRLVCLLLSLCLHSACYSTPLLSLVLTIMVSESSFQQFLFMSHNFNKENWECFETIFKNG